MSEYIDVMNKNGSLKNRVLISIRNDILNSKYKAGESLTEIKLSEELGVSRTPVREALRQLELEGLVDAIPNKGVVVNGITAKDIEDIYEIRMLVEGLAARWAAEKISERELAELQEALELEEYYTKKNNIEQLILFDSRFHEIIFRASNSKQLMNTLSLYHNHVRSARGISIKCPGRAKEALKEHKAIYMAIKERNPAKAEMLTTEHIKNASQNLRNQKEK